MTVYFLHLRDDEDFIEDPEGRDFPDLAAARREAVVAAREMLAERLKRGQILDGQRIEICDASGEVLEVVPFRSVFDTP